VVGFPRLQAREEVNSFSVRAEYRTRIDHEMLSKTHFVLSCIRTDRATKLLRLFVSERRAPLRRQPLRHLGKTYVLPEYRLFNTVSAESLQLWAEVLRAISWPILAFVVIIYFGPVLKEVLVRAEEVSFGTGSTQLTIKRQFKSGALYGLALADKSGSLSPEEIEREIENEANEAANDESIPIFEDTELLWVDDNPSNNIYERGALEERGVQITLSESTEDALEKIETHDFDVIISDMRRGEESRAGYDLLERKQEMSDLTPFVIYSGSGKEEHKREARRHGAIGATNRPQELFQLVRQSIRHSRGISGSSEEKVRN